MTMADAMSVNPHQLFLFTLLGPSTPRVGGTDAGEPAASTSTAGSRTPCSTSAIPSAMRLMPSAQDCGSAAPSRMRAFLGEEYLPRKPLHVHNFAVRHVGTILDFGQNRCAHFAGVTTILR